jgi:hypothetical protein
MSVPTARKNRNQCERWFIRLKALQPVFALEQSDQFAVAAAQDTNATNFTQTWN